MVISGNVKRKSKTPFKQSVDGIRPPIGCLVFFYVAGFHYLYATSYMFLIIYNYPYLIFLLLLLRGRNTFPDTNLTSIVFNYASTG